MAQLHIREQSKPFHARQITRLLGQALYLAGWLTRQEVEDSMEADDQPKLLVSTPDGREFLVTVEPVEDPGQL